VFEGEEKEVLMKPLEAKKNDVVVRMQGEEMDILEELKKGNSSVQSDQKKRNRSRRQMKKKEMSVKEVLRKEVKERQISKKSPREATTTELTKKEEQKRLQEEQTEAKKKELPGKRKEDRLLLIRAGDIETNPGPTKEKNKSCADCGGDIRNGNEYLTCTQCDCNFHKKKTCSDVTKHAMKTLDRTEWRCKECHRENGEEESRNCRECSGAIKRGNLYLECTQCNDVMHKKFECSYLKRSQEEKSNPARWRCLRCTDPARYEKTKERKKGRDPTTGKGGKYSICHGLIRTTNPFMTCSHCKKLTHVKEDCSGETVEGRKRVNKETWKCLTCVQEEEERKKRQEEEHKAPEKVEYVLKEDLTRKRI
jgi:hypothetical protein